MAKMKTKKAPTLSTMVITIKDIKGGFVEVDLAPVVDINPEDMSPAQALACYAIDYINDCLAPMDNPDRIDS